ncbi:hypothetical protein GQR36_19230 [Enterococcus termitis]
MNNAELRQLTEGGSFVEKKKWKKLFCRSVLLLAITTGITVWGTSIARAESLGTGGIPIDEQIPQATALFPEELLNWNAASDPDAPLTFQTFHWHHVYRERR